MKCKMFLRIEIDAEISKPLPADLTLAKRQAIRNALDTLEAVAVKINEGKPNEEQTSVAVLTNTAENLKYYAHLAIPEYPGGVRVLSSIDMFGNPEGGILIDPAIAASLGGVRTTLRQLSQYAKRTEGVGFKADILICNHDSKGKLPDGERITI